MPFAAGLPEYHFGPGTAWLTPVQDAFGNVVATNNASPILIAGIQNIDLDLSAEVKELYGTQSFALAIGRGKQKMGIKISNAQVHGALWNQLFFGQAITNQTYSMVYDTLGSAIPATPFQITPTVPGTGTWVYNLGVRDANNIPLLRLPTGTPATGQYTCAAGVYTFATADTGKTVYIDYQYTATSLIAKRLDLQNLPMGAMPLFRLDMVFPYLGNVMAATFPFCTSTGAKFATKLDDFAYPEFDLSAFAPGGVSPGTLAWSQ
jgi:hypothetical protein